MTPQQYAAWISQGAYGEEKTARQTTNIALLRIQLQSEGWDDQAIEQHINARKGALNGTGTPRQACPDRQRYLQMLTGDV